MITKASGSEVTFPAGSSESNQSKQKPREGRKGRPGGGGLAVGRLSHHQFMMQLRFSVMKYT